MWGGRSSISCASLTVKVYARIFDNRTFLSLSFKISHARRHWGRVITFISGMSCCLHTRLGWEGRRGRITITGNSETDTKIIWIWFTRFVKFSGECVDYAEIHAELTISLSRLWRKKLQDIAGIVVLPSSKYLMLISIADCRLSRYVRHKLIR